MRSHFLHQIEKKNVLIKMAEINDSLFENFFELWDNMIRNGVF